MSEKLSYRTLFAGVVLSLLLTLPALADFQEQKTFSGNSLTVNNLIGEIRVTGHSGGDFQVTIHVQGRDASQERVELRESGDTLSIVFPLSESRKYVYPKLGGGSRTSFNPSNKDGNWLSQVLGSVSKSKVTVAGSGSGLELWADIEIQAPAGAELSVNHGVGKIFATGADGEIFLSTHSGPIQGDRLSGKINLDTGSGHVEAREITGEMIVDTGSGHVEVLGCRCDNLDIDTGSGHVEIEEIEGRRLNVDTGSGHVEARRVSADDVNIDTGSGSVKLYLDRMGAGDFRIDTGSGGITLALPPDASASVQAETGSGGIHLDLGAEVRIRHKEKDEVSFRIGNGDAQVVLDTGSGGIRIVDTN